MYIDREDVEHAIENVRFNCLLDRTQSVVCFDGSALLKFKKLLIQGGHWNIDDAVDTLQNSSDQLRELHKSEVKKDDRFSARSSSDMEAVHQQGRESMVAFVSKTLESREVQGKVFPNSKQEKTEDGSKLAYSIDVEQLIRVYSQ